MKRKAKRFNGEDGSEIREGKEHSGISDETRERARRFVESGGKRDEEEVTSERASSRSVKSTPKATPKRDETPISTQYGRGVRSDYVERPVKKAAPADYSIPKDIPRPDRDSAQSSGPSHGRIENDSDFMRNVKNTVNALPPMIGRPAQALGRVLGGLGSAGMRGFAAGRAEKLAERAGDSVWRAAGERAAATRREGAAKAENLREKIAAAKEAKETARIARRAPRDEAESTMAGEGGPHFRKGGKVSASSRADGIAKRGKTRGKML